MSDRDTKAIIHAMGMLADNLYQIGNGRSPMYSMAEFDELAKQITPKDDERG